MKIIPFLLFLIAVSIFLFVDGSSAILAAMIIGAIAFPTAIWVIMSLYQKMAKQRA